ncbi:MAG: hypothetical protein K2M15_01375 [Oscillospiraceae bacterium]|nr:hypothetical protein [Oscillospiraceae bacterium]MDE7172522.1 hypothetical protein [Oscillospiraceae bacterium]
MIGHFYYRLPLGLPAALPAGGLTALAYVMEKGLADQFCRVPVDPLEAAAKRPHEMG